jgi:hypothetical protein
MRPVNLIARARPILVAGMGITVLGFALMFVSPPLGAWIAVPGMVIVVAGGLLAFGVFFASLFGKRQTNG